MPPGSIGSEGRDLLDKFESWAQHRGISRMTSDTNANYPISPHAHEGCGYRVLLKEVIFIKELEGGGPELRLELRESSCRPPTSIPILP